MLQIHAVPFPPGRRPFAGVPRVPQFSVGLDELDVLGAVRALLIMPPDHGLGALGERAVEEGEPEVSGVAADPFLGG